MADHIPIEQINLLFRKVLSESEFEHQLNVPSKVLKKCPSFAGSSRSFTSFDRNGVAWPFILSIRQPAQYPKPYFVKSVWNPFVVAKHLRAGDVVESTQLGERLELEFKSEPGEMRWVGIMWRTLLILRVWRNEMGWHACFYYVVPKFLVCFFSFSSS